MRYQPRRFQNEKKTKINNKTPWLRCSYDANSFFFFFLKGFIRLSFIFKRLKLWKIDLQINSISSTKLKFILRESWVEVVQAIDWLIDGHILVQHQIGNHASCPMVDSAYGLC